MTGCIFHVEKKVELDDKIYIQKALVGFPLDQPTLLCSLRERK